MSKLRVAINATPLHAPLTGIGNYIVNLGRALADTGAVDPFSFYGWSLHHEAPTPPTGGGPRRPPSGVLELLRRVPFQREIRAVPQRVALLRALRAQRVELYHEPNYVPLQYEWPLVITVHDLSWLHFPQMHPPDRVRWLERGLPRAIDRAGAILVDSAFVRSELMAAFGVPPERVHVAHLGVGGEFRPREAQETRRVLDRHRLQHGSYLLTVGTIEPRKNIGHLLAAYKLLAPAVRERYPLVIAGAQGWRARDLEVELAAAARRAEVRFIGNVPPSELPMLYSGAAASVQPSLYEGFGLPVLEAMASGVAVLASNRSSLPEVLGDAGLLLDPEDPEGTKEQLAKVLGDDALRRRLADAARERAASFTWSACAQATLEAYRAALR